MTAGSTCPPPAVDSCKTRRTELGYPREAWIWETPCRLAAGSAASRKATCGPRARDCITAQGCRPPHALVSQLDQYSRTPIRLRRASSRQTGGSNPNPSLLLHVRILRMPALVGFPTL